MKLIVQIPCLNEEKTLPLVINTIPKKIQGIDEIEILIIDDGSTDKTTQVARKLGVHHIIKHKQNKGLAYSFANGIDAALKLDADIIVNTDADNQYPQQDIPRLIQPILNGTADMVVGDRQTQSISHFSKRKKFFQWFGSAVMRRLSRTPIQDAVSGFRAYSREAAMQLNIVTDFSYVIETIIQAQHKRIAITDVKIQTNAPTRKSRLFSSMTQHMRKSGGSIVRVYTMYSPLRVFLLTGMLIIIIGMIPAVRFTYFFLLGQGAGHVQSLIFAAILIMVGFQVMMTGLVADLIGINRRLTEQALQRIKKIEYNSQQLEKLRVVEIDPELRSRKKNPSGKNRNFPQRQPYILSVA